MSTIECGEDPNQVKLEVGSCRPEQALIPATISFPLKLEFVKAQFNTSSGLHDKKDDNGTHFRRELEKRQSRFGCLGMVCGKDDDDMVVGRRTRSERLLELDWMVETLTVNVPKAERVYPSPIFSYNVLIFSHRTEIVVEADVRLFSLSGMDVDKGKSL
jgi:hypothetical protein